MPGFSPQLAYDNTDYGNLLNVARWCDIMILSNIGSDFSHRLVTSSP